MVTGLWTAFLLSFACASAIAWLAALMRDKSLRPVRELAAFFGRQPKAGRVLVGAFLAVLWAIAGAKPSGGMGCGDGVRHVDVKSRGGCSGDGAPAVAGGTADCLSSSSIPMAFLAYLLTR